MNLVKNRSSLLFLPLALCGFAVAQPIYNLLLDTPVFLLARQNTISDVWALVTVLSVIIPVILALPGWLAWSRWPVFSSLWSWVISGSFAALFAAQVLQEYIAGYFMLFIGLAGVLGLATAWLLLFTRWIILTPVLSAFALMFASWFLIFSSVAESTSSFAGVALEREVSGTPLPHIVFIILDELPLATLLNDKQQIDGTLFPGFARLQSISDWYFNSSSVSDGTVDAVPAILASRFPGEEASDLTVAAQPINLFTILGNLYQHNAAETVTRLCPDSLCPRTGSAMSARFKALLLDLSAIYLHRVAPDRWVSALPNVTNNWSGFFARRQVFFPDGWLKHAGEQSEIDRPGYFRSFTESIENSDRPVLNFLHILFPHEPLAYFPNGENYGLQWMQGQKDEQWGDVEWGIISGKQRHYLQTQYVDRLLGDLLNHLQSQQMLEDSMLVVVADHGINFVLNDTRRVLSDSNHAAMLRVPMFIKFPGQMQARRITRPVMTVDILPTILPALGVSSEALNFDGIDLESPDAASPRPRFASSYLKRELNLLDETSMDIAPLVTSNRSHLGLGSEKDRLWQIGPYDDYRGKTMESVCEQSSTGVGVHISGFKALPDTPEELTLRAFVSGYFSGDMLEQTSKPFLITSNDLIVASGNTWLHNDRWLFFALVEPKYVRQADWAPKVWLVDGDQCYGKVRRPRGKKP